MDNIFIIFICVFIFTIVYICIVNQFLRMHRSSYLVGLINKADYSKFFNEIDKSIHSAKTDEHRNIYILLKTYGIIRCKEWDQIGDLISSISVPFSNASLKIFCLNILHLFANEKQNEALRLLTKIDVTNQHIMNDLGIKTCFAINDYYSNGFEKSETNLKKLSQMGKDSKYHKFCKSSIYFYLGLIAIKQKNIMKSKQYLTKVLLYSDNSAFVNKAKSILDKMNEG